jgi:hypothetical protein
MTFKSYNAFIYLKPDINLNTVLKFSSCVTMHKAHLHKKDQSINAVQRNERCLFI